MFNLRFKFSLWPTLAALVGIGLALALGNWQLGRGHDKSMLAQRIRSADRATPITLPATEVNPDDVVWHRVEVRGRFEPKFTIFIDNRVLHGAVGYHVITPLRIGDSARYVLVNRGWVAGTNARGRLPDITTPSGAVTVVGLAMVPSKRYLELSTNVAEGSVWENLTLERYRAAVPIAIQPVIIQQENDLGDGLARVWAEPDLGIQMHYGYAFQWFAMSAAILIYYLVTHVSSKRSQQPD